jgi:mono/diheme cytochrome c family protein
MASHPRRRGLTAAAILPPFALLLLAVPLVAVSRPQGGSAAARTPEQLYRAACMNCHGPGGTGAPQTTLGFQVPVPDFTDCSFATREPDSDWLAVIADGGPARAFDKHMPAFRDALTPEEMNAVLLHVRGFCANEDWPRGELNLPRPLVTEKAFPEDEFVVSSAIRPEGGASVSNRLVYEKRLGPRNQIEIVVPYGFGDTDAGWVNGIGDVAFGFKRALYHDHRKGTIFSLTGEAVLPTGDEKDGFGKGYTVFEPFATFGQILPGDSFVQFQGGIEIPSDSRKAAREAFWRTTVGKSISQGDFGRTWSPMVEVLGFRELEDGHPALWDLVPQVQVTLSTRQHIMANVGVRVPVNRREGRHTQVLFYFLWDWFDGPLAGGW